MFFDGSWFLTYSQPWIYFYYFGNIPAITLGVISLIALLCLLAKKLRKKIPKRAAIFLILTLIIGPGFLVNSVFKSHWGRSRPRNIIQFNGEKQFSKVWVKTDGDGRSFPSGHASIGFFLFTPYFLFIKKNKNIAYSIFIIGFIYGSLMGVGRVVQGAHFFSDIIWSFGIVYYTDIILYYFIKPNCCIKKNVLYFLSKKRTNLYWQKFKEKKWLC